MRKSVGLAIVRSRVEILGASVKVRIFIGPHIWHEYWCDFQEAESRGISISCKKVFLNR